MNIQVNAKVFKIVQQFAATNDIRYYLNGVFVKAGKYVGATNGHFMIVVPNKTSDRDAIIPRIPASFLKSGQVVVDDGTVKVVDGACRFISPDRLIDGKYPDFARVIAPHKWERGIQGSVDMKYMKAILAVGAGGVEFFHSDAAQLAMFNSNNLPTGSFVVLMNRRDKPLNPFSIMEIVS